MIDPEDGKVLRLVINSFARDHLWSSADTIRMLSEIIEYQIIATTDFEMESVSRAIDDTTNAMIRTLAMIEKTTGRGGWQDPDI